MIFLIYAIFQSLTALTIGKNWKLNQQIFKINWKYLEIDLSNFKINFKKQIGKTWKLPRVLDKGMLYLT